MLDATLCKYTKELPKNQTPSKKSYKNDVDKYIRIYFFLRNIVFIFKYYSFKKEKMAQAKDNQELIVRQSQLQRSVELFHLFGIKPSLQEVCRLSQILTQFIFDGDHKSADIKQFEKVMGITQHTTNVVKKEVIDLLTQKQ